MPDDPRCRELRAQRPFDDGMPVTAPVEFPPRLIKEKGGGIRLPTEGRRERQDDDAPVIPVPLDENPLQAILHGERTGAFAPEAG